MLQRSVLPLLVFVVTAYNVSDAMLARAMAKLKPPRVTEARLALLAPAGPPESPPPPPPPLDDAAFIP